MTGWEGDSREAGVDHEDARLSRAVEEVDAAGIGRTSGLGAVFTHQHNVLDACRRVDTLLPAPATSADTACYSDSPLSDVLSPHSSDHSSSSRVFHVSWAMAEAANGAPLGRQERCVVGGSVVKAALPYRKSIVAVLLVSMHVTELVWAIGDCCARRPCWACVFCPFGTSWPACSIVPAPSILFSSGLLKRAMVGGIGTMALRAAHCLSLFFLRRQSQQPSNLPRPLFRPDASKSRHSRSWHIHGQGVVVYQLLAAVR